MVRTPERQLEDVPGFEVSMQKWSIVADSLTKPCALFLQWLLGVYRKMRVVNIVRSQQGIFRDRMTSSD